MRQALPVFVNSFNQPTYVRDTVFWLHTQGFRNITVLDNASDSPGLLSYFASKKFRRRARLRVLPGNLGPRKAIVALQDMIGPSAPFIFTDPDLALPEPPAADFLTRMFELGRKHERVKVGLALDISDTGDFRDIRLKRANRTVPITQWERRYWRNEVEERVFAASVDTTFFLHVPAEGETVPLAKYGRFQPRVPALRIAAEGFLAKHRPWYTDDGQTEEERRFYRSRASAVATWAQDQRETENPGAEAVPG